MARVRPFRAFRYATTSPDVTPLTAPPYDVINDTQRAELLARNQHNIVALELPDGPLDPSLPGNRYETGADRWETWRRQGVLAQDAAPTIYVLEQRWMRGETPVRRLAFIVAVGLERFEDGVVLPHERTLPRALDDRLYLTRSCAANFSQVFGLFSDPLLETSALLEFATAGEPVEYARGDDDVESRLWALADEGSIGEVERFFAERQIFIADGHHRYTTALAYRDERRAAGASPGNRVSDDPPYDYVMMALANMDDPELVVLPTHRVADAEGRFEPEAFWAGLEDRFLIEELPPGHPSSVLHDNGPPAFIVQTRDARRRLVTLRADVDLDSAITAPYSSAWKHLDVAVLQELVLSPLLGIHPDRPQTLDRLTFVKDAHEALAINEQHDAAFILRATRMQQLREVALAGETMPQKSTYFYPKLLSGLALRSLG